MSLMTQTRKDAITTTYEDVERLLCFLCWKFQKQYGGDFEDWKEIASEAFLDAYLSYDPAKAKFTTHIYTKVQWRLRNHIDKELNRRKTLVFDSALVHHTCQKKTCFDIGSFLRELGEDARLVVLLVLETPAELVELCGMKGLTRMGLRKYLYRLGWPMYRVANVFREINRELT